MAKCTKPHGWTRHRLGKHILPSSEVRGDGGREAKGIVLEELLGREHFRAREDARIRPRRKGLRELLMLSKKVTKRKGILVAAYERQAIRATALRRPTHRRYRSHATLWNIGQQLPVQVVRYPLWALAAFRATNLRVVFVDV